MHSCFTRMILAMLSGWAAAGWSEVAEAQRPPNIVIVFVDDMGYADIGAFGADQIETPHLDRMAREGMRFTDFVVSSAVCSASRAALMTGCYHRRVGIRGALGPGSKIGIHQDEVTLGELCQQQGYATAIFGKWHLGHHHPFLPLQHGFDEYFGLPYSNDMWPLHPTNPDAYPNLPLIEGNQVINPDVRGEDQAQLTTQYTEKSVDFIRRHRDQPFLLYLPHSMVHVPLYVSDKFKGKSRRGLFGDVVMELDWSMGQIFAVLSECNLDKQTLVIFTSDNGPWLSYGDHAGSAKPLREGKGTMFEGGYRVPTLMRWPGKIPAGSSCDELASTIDLLPTIAKLIGAPLPPHTIDGQDIRPLMFADADAQSPHQAFYCYYAGQLQAVRDRRWKLHFPHRYRTLDGRPGGRDGKPVPYTQAHTQLELYDLKEDPGEKVNLIDQHPGVVERLQKHAEQARLELGDRKPKDETKPVPRGRGIRPAGRIEASPH